LDKLILWLLLQGQFIRYKWDTPLEIKYLAQTSIVENILYTLYPFKFMYTRIMQ